MPIFHDDLEPDRPASSESLSAAHQSPPKPPSTRLRRLSEESLPLELCEGPVPDSPGRPSTPKADDGAATLDRAGLIERLKRAQSPTWIPNRHLESIYHKRSPPSIPRPTSESPGLLPPAQITQGRDTQGSREDMQRHGLEIERPRSALHSGDFTNDQTAGRSRHREQNTDRATDLHAARTSWVATSPPRDFHPLHFARRQPPSDVPDSFRISGSPLSSSLSSSFIYQAPTSPLVQSEINEDIDFSMPMGGLDLPSRRPGSRRYTLGSISSSPLTSPSSRSFMPSRTSLHRRESSLPYQAHQPRRSLTSTPKSQGGFSQGPLSRSRRPSLGSDASPTQHAMVGSYEESILRGRMSTTPSKPLDFQAQIGVLGMGNCKASLRCPPHVTLAFAAVYYSYNTTTHGRSSTDDGPSPYVGQIDLENGLPNAEEESRLRRKAQSRYAERKPADDGGADVAMPAMTEQNLEADHRNTSRQKRRSGSPKAPPGGSYRIPERGQLQVIIKNQNKTALKLFLVPYDLTGMEPGTKTFIRQRSTSAGPFIDGVPLASELGRSERPILRYLIHLHICCPAKGRYYLYKSIRIVFANRVPDGKEKLRNETSWPEPRFSPYKPTRVVHPPLFSSGGPGAMLAAENAHRRRSLGVPMGAASSQTFDMMSGMYSPSQPSSSGPAGGNTLPVDSIPFRLPARDRPDSDVSDNNTTSTTTAGLRSPAASSSQPSRPSTKDSGGITNWGTTWYEKLNKGDHGYGGNAFALDAAGSPRGAEGLLSQRLRSLGVMPTSPPEPAEE